MDSMGGEAVMQGEFSTQEVLIWGKTYPELSFHHKETVCTGGCLKDGRPVRIYPVPFRMIEQQRRYKLYNWIRVPLAPSHGDQRPESWRIDPDKLEVLGTPLGTEHGWEARRAIVFRDRSWHYGCLEELKQAQEERRTSLGLVPVRRVVKVDLKRRPAEEKYGHEAKLRELQSHQDLFREAQPDLQWLPERVRVRWECRAQNCPTHRAQILDWGLGELGRREGTGAMLSKMESLCDTDRYDLRFFMGNIKRFPQNFVVVGVWYPLRKQMQQRSLFTPGL